jgi:peptidoglycan/LPS O-acetylase OafA/YrhL
LPSWTQTAASELRKFVRWVLVAAAAEALMVLAVLVKGESRRVAGEWSRESAEDGPAEEVPAVACAGAGAVCASVVVCPPMSFEVEYWLSAAICAASVGSMMRCACRPRHTATNVLSSSLTLTLGFLVVCNCSRRHSCSSACLSSPCHVESYTSRRASSVLYHT